MKKVLFATTALVFSAGFAAAEVTLSGDGRMGMVYNGDDVNFTSRARVQFNLSGETDGGLSFGGSFRADNAGSGADGAEEGAAGSVFISGAFGRLTMGDVDSAAENAVGDLSGVGLTGLGDLNESTYLSSGEEAPRDPEMLYAYSAGDLSFYLSMTDGQSAGGSVSDVTADDEFAYSLGVAYSMGDYSVGLGYEKLDDSNVDHIIVGGSAAFGAATVKAIYGEASDIDFTQYGLSVDYVVGATTITGFYRSVELGAADADFFGLGASYDLGGGASLKGGIVDNDVDTVADFGVAFKF